MEFSLYIYRLYTQYTLYTQDDAKSSKRRILKTDTYNIRGLQLLLYTLKPGSFRLLLCFYSFYSFYSLNFYSLKNKTAVNICFIYRALY